jgi:AraC-like DNA-binding protein
LEPSEQWLEDNDLTFKDLGSYRIEDDPIKSSELLRLLNSGFKESDVESQLLEIVLPKAERENSAQPWQKRLNTLLQEDRAFRWTLKSLAQELAVHPVYLARVFRAQFGCSATTYLLRRRLMNCAKALTEGRPAVDIAFENGFADQSHFARSFRTFYGTPPAEFQRKWFQLF